MERKLSEMEEELKVSDRLAFVAAILAQNIKNSNEFVRITTDLTLRRIT